MYFCKIPTKMNVREIVSKVLLLHFRISATCVCCFACFFFFPAMPLCTMQMTCNCTSFDVQRWWRVSSLCLVWKLTTWRSEFQFWPPTDTAEEAGVWGRGGRVIPTAGIVQYLNDPLDKNTFCFWPTALCPAMQPVFPFGVAEGRLCIMYCMCDGKFYHLNLVLRRNGQFIK